MATSNLLVYNYRDKAGTWFFYKGDEVLIPRYPRRKEGKFYSISFYCFFGSLKELDDFWEGYWNEERKHGNELQY